MSSALAKRKSQNVHQPDKIIEKASNYTLENAAEKGLISTHEKEKSGRRQNSVDLLTYEHVSFYHLPFQLGRSANRPSSGPASSHSTQKFPGSENHLVENIQNMNVHEID